MKKFFVLLVLSIILTSCGKASNSDIEQAKNDALNGVVDSTIDSGKIVNSGSIFDEIDNQNKDITYNYLTEEELIRIDTLSLEDFGEMKKEITGTTIGQVDKIDVSYQNSTTGKKSNFKLSKFKSGDSNFMFRAFKEYDTLDYGTNIYVVSAYSGAKVSKLELKVNLENNLDTETSTGTINEEVKKEEIINEPIKVSELPVSTTFGNPVEIGNGKFTYSDVKGLELEKISTNILKNDELAVTDFLRNRYKNIFYWNTKRSISGENGVSFFVVRIEGSNYLYEKHYYNGEYYGVVSLEKGDFDSSLPIEERTKVLSELNSSLREKNSSFPMVKISDSLFQSFKK